MAYKAVGFIVKIGEVENLESKNGTTFQRRNMVIKQKRFDQNTGEEFTPNFMSFDLTSNHVSLPDSFRVGDRVQVSFDTVGTEYTDKGTGEIKYFNSLRAFGMTAFTQQTAAPATAPAAPATAAPAAQPEQSDLPF